MPTRYRDALLAQCDGQLVLTVNRDRRLALYPLPKWRHFERQLMQLPAFDKRAEGLRRLYVGYAQELVMDGAGRLLLPAVLREVVHIARKVVLLGQFEIFEIWPENAWVEGLDELFAIAGDVSGDALFSQILL